MHYLTARLAVIFLLFRISVLKLVLRTKKSLFAPLPLSPSGRLSMLPCNDQEITMVQTLAKLSISIQC